MEEEKKTAAGPGIARPADFIRRRKSAVISIFIACLAAGHLAMTGAKPIHTLSLVIEAPSLRPGRISEHGARRYTEALELAGRINERAFGEEAAGIIDTLRPGARAIRPRGLVRIDWEQPAGLDTESGKALLEELVSALYRHYESEVEAAREEFKRLTTVPGEEDKTDAGAPEPAGETAAPDGRIRNIRISTPTHVSETVEPSAAVTLGVSGFTGIVLGIITGVVKELKAGSRQRR